MRARKISKDDLFGRFFAKKPEGKQWDSYYKTLETLRPFFKGKESNKIIKGFYLNICGVDPRDFDSVRISYFVDIANSEEAVSIFKEFFANKGILEIKRHVYPKEIILAEDYGGEEYEERFRNFLVLETQIGLELIGGNLLQARILFVTYRWQVRKASLPFREHFEPTFHKYSPTYNSLSDEEKHEFLADLEAWPNPRQVDWAHMMVNLVLGCDWNNALLRPDYLTPGRPLSIPEINSHIRDLGFQIPLDWKPNEP